MLSLVLGAFVIGLAGSAHCVVACGPVTAAALRALPEGAARSRGLAAMQLGRLLSYTLAGSAVGSFGVALYGLLDLAFLHTGMRWLSAAGIAYAGLILLRLVPGIPAFRLARPARPRSIPASLSMGLLWGAAPCSMVYNALLLAMLSGSTSGGAAVMLAFGAGTLPALMLAVAAALSAWANIPRNGVRRIAGVLLLSLAASALMMGDTHINFFCHNR